MIIKFFSEYVVPLLKYINHPEFIQEWKLNLHAAAHGRNIDASMSKTSYEKEIDRNDSNLYCPTTIKDKIKCFPFLTIMEHTANILKP